MFKSGSPHLQMYKKCDFGPFLDDLVSRERVAIGGWNIAKNAFADLPRSDWRESSCNANRDAGPFLVSGRHFPSMGTLNYPMTFRMLFARGPKSLERQASERASQRHFGAVRPSRAARLAPWRRSQLEILSCQMQVPFGPGAAPTSSFAASRLISRSKTVAWRRD